MGHHGEREVEEEVVEEEVCHLGERGGRGGGGGGVSSRGERGVGGGGGGGGLPQSEIGGGGWSRRWVITRREVPSNLYIHHLTS